MEDLIEQFIQTITAGEVEVYNEFSLQHELGIFLRYKLPQKRIQFERNVSFFELDKSNFQKKEIDISIYDDLSCPDAAIELKFPRNGQYPESMFSFCQDIQFTEELIHSSFQSGYVLIFADDKLFYKGNDAGIYGYFRGGKELTGTVSKPTGTKEGSYHIRGRYSVKWKPIYGSLKYTLIKSIMSS